MEMVSAKLQKQLAELPDKPGVYIMRDINDVIVYVGKATSLKQRVRSYFQSGVKKLPKTQAQMKVVESIEWVLVSSPDEALVLECNLIKEHNPKYNIMLRDDKHYPYLMLTLTEEFPRLVVVRNTKSDGNRYFGPYVSATSMHMTEQLIGRLFQLRTCSNANFRNRKRPCLNYQIGKCLAPCVGYIDKASYQETVKQVLWFLEGNSGHILKDLQKRMNEAAEALRFEEAASLRDKIQAVKKVQSRQYMDNGTENRDLIAVETEAGAAVAMIFYVREGKVVGREHFFLENAAEKTMAELLSAFLGRYYSGVDFLPPEICLAEPIEDEAAMAKYLSERRGGKVSLIVPKIGDKKRLLALVRQNARMVLRRELEERAFRDAASTTALSQLQQAFNLKTPPYRIECYDNSHWQGTYTVGSMVTFCGGRPNKALYRHIRIKTVANGDDFAAMRESLARRLARGLKEREKLKNGELKPEQAPMAQWPDLIVIDGGKEQLKVVVDILETLALDIPVVSLAKRLEEVYLPGQDEPMILDRHSPGLQLLQRARDEAHRFGITYQRKLREHGQTESLLDDIPGIGPARRTALLKAFGSLEGIREATEEELALTPSMNRRAAAELYAYLRRRDKE
jgi:excinuclease ABC subunit C